MSCLFAWKHEAEIIKLIKTWLERGLNHGQVEKPMKKQHTRKKSKGKATKKGGATKRGRPAPSDSEDESDHSEAAAVTGEAAIFIALRLLNLIMEKEATREKFFKRFELSSAILELFQSYLTIIENRFSSDREEEEEEMSDAVLFQMMDSLMRFLLHAFGSEDPQWKEQGDQVLSRLLRWTTDVLLPLLHADAEEYRGEDYAQAFMFIDKVHGSPFNYSFL